MNSVKEVYNRLVQSLRSVYSEGEARSVVRILFEDLFQVYDFSSDKEMSAEQLGQLAAIETRLLQNEPVQYILGVADFYGLKLKVDTSVLIPRQETEELVFWILENGGDAIRVLDIGTGSGCIPITLNQARKDWKVSALDVSAAALAIAQSNAKSHQLPIEFYEASILDQMTWDRFAKQDIIVSNPPYIPHEESHLMPEQVKAFEPSIALFVENENPLLFYETIATFAQQKLKPNGWLYFELNEYNAEKVQSLLENKGFQNVELRQDLNGKNRMIRAQRIE